MNWLLIRLGVGLVPIGLAVWLPSGQQPWRGDQKIAVGMQTTGSLALASGSTWLLLLIPQLSLSAGFAFVSVLLMIVTLFTVTLPCQTSIAMWMDRAERLVAFGVA